MLTTMLLTLTLAAEPRGFDARDPVKLLIELDKRLPDWLASKGDRTTHLATKAELETYAGGRKDVADQLLAEQSAKPGATPFTGAVRAFVDQTNTWALVSFFDAQGKRCAVLLLASGDRFVVGSGPVIDDTPFKEVAFNQKMIFEKKQNTWSRLSPYTSLPCGESLKRAAKELFFAEKLFFGDHARYAASPGELGDLELPSDATIKLTLTGDASNPHFKASVSLNGGEMTISDTEVSPALVKACAK